MSNKDEIDIQIKEDGTLVVTTDKISGPNHMNADRFVKKMAEYQGGKVETKKKLGRVHSHTHDHTHDEIKTNN